MRAAIVVQRYGNEVLGGAETLARRVAELLAPELELTVVTTCALDYLTWADHYPAGEDEVNGVRVLRFPVPKPRDPKRFARISDKAYRAPRDLELGSEWMRAQGPHSPELLEHLRDQGSQYDVVAFITYLYATTTEALPLVADRAVLYPTMHDEPPLRLAIFDEIFARSLAVLFSTPEERELARSRFGVEDDRARIIGVGVDELEGDGARFQAETGVARPYAAYLGRLDPSKGVPDLIAHHTRYRTGRPDGLDLVLIGSGDIDLPAGNGIHALGFVPEQLKHDAIAGAEVVICPSPYESLSLSQLEAWTHARPTLSNATSPVLVGQSQRSGGGLWYENGTEYAAMLDLLARAEPLADAIGSQGRRYARENYSWDRVRDGWLAALSGVARPARADSP
ncbi:MAG: glycosyltransferase family 4 protein [Actinobacteria bacterium]|nr:glycosyltransferase family 4 protein [Actinomycetota bacterium]